VSNWFDPSAEPVIRARNVGKRFYSMEHRSGSAREWFIRAMGREPKTVAQPEFTLQDISFEVRPGEILALIGDNGSGKSTMLRLLAGIYRPSEGSIETVGRVASVIELGAGLHAELSGIENAWLYASILGLNESEIRKRLPVMIGFADIGDFMNVPVKYYSSGMVARLAFSVAMLVKPDIFLVDEVLAVGDQRFQEKCVYLMEEYVNRGLTLVVVTHALELVDRLATKAVWLDKGKVMMHDDAKKVIDAYQAWSQEKSTAAEDVERVFDDEDGAP